MIIVVGHYIVDPADRDQVITLSEPVVAQARVTEGCLDFAVSADPVVPSRVNVAERWASRAALEQFRGDGIGADQDRLVVSYDIDEYEIDDVDPAEASTI